MKTTVMALFAVLAILIVLALLQGQATFNQAWRASLGQLLKFLPILVIAILVAGFTETLIPEGVIKTWLSDASGWRGLALGWFAGVITPGGSIIGLPLIAALYKSGVGLSVLMTYSTSLATLSLLRIPLEGRTVGSWRRELKKDSVTLALHFFRAVNRAEYRLIEEAAERYGAFLEKKVELA